MKRRSMSMLLTLSLLLSLLPTATISAAAEEATLPAGYTQVEYIESYGDGHVDTGWSTKDVTSSYAYEVTYAASAAKPSASGTLLGAYEAVGGSPYQSRMGIIGIRSDGTTRIAFGSVLSKNAAVKWNTSTDRTTVKTEVTRSGEDYYYTITKDGVVVGEDLKITGSPISPSAVYLFKVNTSSRASEASAAKCYGLKIWQDGELVRDFVPCVENTSGIAGLYDLMTNEFRGAASGMGVYGPDGVASVPVRLTAPAGVNISVSYGFADGGDAMGEAAATTEDGLTTHLYELEVGCYRFLAKGSGYYTLDKNFIVTYDDLKNGGKDINADPGEIAGTYWEQSPTCPYPTVREFTDELLQSSALKLSDETKAQYAEVFTTPSFSPSKARNEFTTQAEMLQLIADTDAECSNMRSYILGQSGKYAQDIPAIVFTKTDLSSAATLEQAAALVRANGKPTLQLQAQVHGSEQSCSEGALALMKSLAGQYGDQVLDTVNVVMIPRVNVDGARDYSYSPPSASNINRDYFKLELVETKFLVHVYNLFKPEVVTDQHEFRSITENTDGYLYDVKLAVTHNQNLPERLNALTDEVVDYELSRLPEQGLYPSFYRDGVCDTTPVVGKEYFAMRGSFSVCFEVPGQRKGKMYWDRRVLSHYLSMRNLIDFVVANADHVKDTVAQARAEIAAMGTTFDADNNVVVLDTTSNGGTPMRLLQPSFNLTDGSFKDANATRTFYKFNVAAVTRPRPLAYVVPKDASGIAKVLAIAKFDEIEYYELEAGDAMLLRQYGGTMEGATLGAEQFYRFEKGAYVFPTAQESGIVLSILMEPDVLDALKNPSELHKASFVQQGVLSVSDIYRCETLSGHELSLISAVDATCETNGNIEHYLCACGKLYADAEGQQEITAESVVIPATGHKFQQSGESFVCSVCGAEKASLTEAAASAGSDGEVALAADATVETLMVSSGVSIDLGGNTLTVESGLAVSNGGAIENGTLRVKDGAVVDLGANGGFVPVWTGAEDAYQSYAIHAIDMKVGKNVLYLEDGVRYALGYKYADHAAYLRSANASAAQNIKLGVSLTMRDGDDTLTGDYVYKATSIAKMAEVSANPSAFYRINLTLKGSNADRVDIAPVIKVKALGFRALGAGAEDEGPEVEVAEVNGEKYTSLAAAVAAAETLGTATDIMLLDNITYKRPTSLTVNGKVRFVVADGKDITISGPLTIDGQGVSGECVLFRCTGAGSKLTMLNGVTIQNYTNEASGSGNNSYGAAIRVDTTASAELRNVTVKNCTSPKRGVIYLGEGVTIDIANCNFTDNTATTEYGGVIGAYGTATISVRDTIFTGNRAAASMGGAIALNGAANLTVDDCTFNNNSTGGGNGGAIYTAASSAMTIRNSEFTGNSSSASGGVIYSSAVGALIDGCSFTGNKGTNYGGVIYNTKSGTMTIKGCTVTGNRLPNKNNGIALYLAGPTVIESSTVTGNTGTGTALEVFVYTNGNITLKGECYLGRTGFTSTNTTSAKLDGLVTGEILWHASDYSIFAESTGRPLLVGDEVAGSIAAFTLTDSSYEILESGYVAAK